MSPDAPNLRNSVERLKSLSKNLLNRSPKDVGEVYLAAMGLLVHLNKDQTTIHARRSQNGENNSNNKDNSKLECPSPEEIPAVSAVLHDEKLFGALVRCLHSGAAVGDGSSNSINNSSVPSSSIMSSDAIQQGRKRTMSVSGDTMSSKALKLTHSPIPSRKNSIVMETNRKTAYRTPVFKLPVLVATILYAACAHLDHWPVPLVEAYAVDCFGSRTWVDDEDCALLVQNLSLVHKCCEETENNNNNGDDADSTSETGKNLSPEKDKEATQVAEAYKGFSMEEPPVAVEATPASAASHQRRPSMSSVSSQVSQNNNNKHQLLDSDSERSKRCALDMKASKKRKTDGDSSSSGEEEDDDDTDVVMSESNDGESKDDKRKKGPPHRSSSNGSVGEPTMQTKKLYPIVQRHLNLERVRARYFGLNLDAAIDAVYNALLDRIAQKSKQNSGLLQTLPSFTSIPQVRALVSENLGKWLQSPALAGLSRTLFAATVEKMKFVDPPLPEDLKAIDFILAMKLKANQFSAHIENVTAIANRIPTANVANHMYSQLLKASLVDAAQGPSDDSLSMVAAIHKSLPAHISYEAMAASLLEILANGDGSEITSENRRQERVKLVRRLRKLVRALSSKISASFDGFQLLDALLSLGVSEEKWSLEDEEDKARIMFQCVTLHIASVAGIKESSKSASWRTLVKAPGVEDSVRQALRKSRRMLLHWCCNDYGPSYSKRRKKKDGIEMSDGAATPDFVSAIGPDSQEESIPPWLNTMRCLLMIEEVNSDLMNHFLTPSDRKVEDGWNDEQERIALCASFGADVDDAMIAVILKASSSEEGGLSPDMSIKLLEHLFESCGKRKGAALQVTDPDLVWEMYKLAHYTPSKELISLRLHEDEEEDGANSEKFKNLPRLALTGLWWRVTILGLIMCGSNPEKIGSVVWKDHPTLSALIKMVTSTKYRFPTVDCDEVSRERMKHEEQAARDEETKVAELLFLPPKKKKDTNSTRSGSRTSRRLLKQQQEKEAAAELAETNRRKKLIKNAQKSIMLWDPDGAARKPPRESAELLLSAEELFGLSSAFQRCTDPDFLLHTIGGTTRGAIERAYDWLIPIISHLPDAISRLPSSTSCFLLLRAYGTDGKRRAQLKELSTPLLHHVQDSLRGAFGEAESKNAFDILLSDVASHHSERRKSSRRVLHDALGSLKGTPVDSKPGVAAWMRNILRVKHAAAVVPIAMTRMSTAAKFERGKVLKSLVMALQDYILFAEKNGISVLHRFPLLLSLLVSQRPNVYAEAIDSFSDFRSLVVKVIHDEICGDSEPSTTTETLEGSHVVSIKLKSKSNKEIVSKTLSGSLLQTTCILLSVWSSGAQSEDEDTSCIDSLVDSLMPTSDGAETQTNTAIVGLASAKHVGNNEIAMTVDSWIMLCKARNDGIGKRAALCAPEEFLGRLLLSSGLPRISLLAMVDRISLLGKESADIDSAYRNLLVPSASSEWDIGRVGSPEDVGRRLLGRLSAYLRAGTLDKASSGSFFQWLLKECRVASSPKPLPTKKTKGHKSKQTVTLPNVSSILSHLNGPLTEDKTESLGPAVDVSDLDDFMSSRERTIAPFGGDVLGEISDSFMREDPRKLNDALENYFDFLDETKSNNLAPSALAIHLAKQTESLGSKSRWAVTAILKWLPRLSRDITTPDLWMIIFSGKQDDLLSLFLDELALLCIQEWSQTHIEACSKWIASQDENQMKELSARRVADFLVKTSILAPPEAEVLSDTQLVNTNPEWGTSETHAASLIRVCLQAAMESGEKEDSFNVHSPLPSWLSLLESLGSRGKKQLIYLTDTILRTQQEQPGSSCAILLDRALLHLYLLQPSWMNLGSSPVRTALLRTSVTHAGIWRQWRSSLDDLLNEGISNLASDPRASRTLAEYARKHPLLILRKIPDFISMLEEDAIAKDSTGADSRGVVHGKSLSDPAEASYHGRSVKVHIKHWGYSFTEPLWNIVLDIFAGIHKEVLFQSGVSLGFLDLLNTYLRLLAVQLHLLSAEAAGKLKGKFSEVLKVFGQTNAKGCHAWWGSALDGSEIRNILVSCDLLSPQQAIDSIRSTTA